jgi:TPR repeat protein
MIPSRLLLFTYFAVFCAQTSLSVCRADDLNIEMLRKSADQGDAEAQISLAGAYFKGQGVPQDNQRAAAWLRQAAEQGNPKAQYNLGLFYKRGLGLRQDVAEAVKWYRKSAEQDFAEADLQLGQLYYSGDVGIDKNYPEAAKWLTKAAEHGKLWAQNTLGVMYEEGYGVDKDPKQAFNWFQRAAERGDAKAQSNLGHLYAEGIGVEKDLVKAYQWLTIAAQQGEITAPKMLVGVAPVLTPDQIAEGKRLAAEWRVRGERWSFRSYLCGFSPPTPRPLWLRLEREAKAGASLTRGEEGKGWSLRLPRHRVVVFCVNSFRMRSRSDGVKLRWMPTRLRLVRGCSVLESGSL